MLFIALAAVIVFALLFQTVVQNVQESANPELGADNWLTPEHYTTFHAATTLLTNLWTYIVAIAIFGLLYWAVIYTQRKNVGGA